MQVDGDVADNMYQVQVAKAEPKTVLQIPVAQRAAVQPTKCWQYKKKVCTKVVVYELRPH